MTQKRQLWAGCLLAGIGWLPVHLMPFLIAAAISTLRLTTVEAGFMASAFYFGQLLSAALLPVVLRDSINRNTLLVIIFTGASVSYSTGFLPNSLFYPMWFFYGSLNGILLYVGAITIAGYRNRPLAFTMRISTVSALAGSVIAVAFFLKLDANYRDFILLISGSSALIGFSLCFLLSVQIDFMAVHEKVTFRNDSIALTIGLVMFFAFLVGQFGFISYAIEFGSQRGFLFRDMTFSVACSKILASIILFKIAIGYNGYNFNKKSLYSTAALVASIYIVNNSSLPSIFMLGFFFWETSVNTISSLMQGILININPLVVSRIIIFTLLAGSGVGSLTSSLFIEAGWWREFILFCLVSSCFPFAWIVSRGKISD